MMDGPAFKGELRMVDGVVSGELREVITGWPIRLECRKVPGGYHILGFLEKLPKAMEDGKDERDIRLGLAPRKGRGAGGASDTAPSSVRSGELCEQLPLPAQAEGSLH